MEPRLLAVGDLHVSYAENRAVTEGLRPTGDGDWLIVAGDVADKVEDIEWALGVLTRRFARVIWVPGNHELWTVNDRADGLRGVARYEYLVEMCRGMGVLTPEDPYALWEGSGGPALIAPLFLLYDYSFLPPGCRTKEEGLAYAYKTGVVCVDERLLHPDPYPSREAWCAARVALTEKRLAECDPELPLVLVNHWPLVRNPTEVLWYPEFAQWCGTTATADWHRKFPVKSMIYGHLHIPRETNYDGVPFEEVSLGYPREWKKRAKPPQLPRIVL
ncbi:metallophosphoesterase [Actinocorallia sp. API 0066]|uniref:metallophosphoesterase family protein n=1 Tax=Actinocorallia sp. API 0066 TaxID=2896846 RepID=UPI001E6157D8|nr:metallophosphoesterase [Actinocorallia sp. API 0066]MCD0450662.1 metallophosphoesterase [Actinocorallia sp. API 0066]